MAADREYDLLIYGAYGFTAMHLVSLLASKRVAARWAIAGRSQEKLDDLKARVFKRTGAKQIFDVPSLQVEIADLARVAGRARVLVNCVGPYALTGAEVVQKCLESGTHYLDFSGEPKFIADSIRRFSAEAAERRVFVVHACGFDSTPADLGVLFALASCEDGYAVSSCDSYLTLSNCHINVGTFATALHSLSDRKGAARGGPAPARRKGKKSAVRKYPFFAPEVGAYAVLFPGSDSFVVRTTQAALARAGEAHLPGYNCYVVVGSLFSLVTLCAFALAFLVLSAFGAGRSFLLRHVELLSAGRVLKAGPPDAKIAQSSFCIRFVTRAVGEKGDLEVVSEVCGPDPGYVTTPVCVLECFNVLLAHASGARVLPRSGGVFTPGGAFSGSDIVQRLEDSGIRFRVVSKKHLRK